MPSEEKKADQTSIVTRLARPNILRLHPYRCARDDYSTGILLDANENAIGPTTTHPDDNTLHLNRYPCPYQIPLKTQYAAYRGRDILEPNQIFTGVGSDEAIDLLMRIFCVPGGEDEIMITPPTYGMYKVCADVNDVRVKRVDLTEEFDLRVDEMLRAATPNTKLMFICSPGNPTSKSIPLSDIRRICESSSYRGLVIVDEAYVDFSTKGSAVELVKEFPNVVVLQTLSKAFGLAGIRLGFAISNPEIIQLMNNVKAPYNINSLTSDIAQNAMNNISILNANVAVILQQREIVHRALTELEFVLKVFPSDANFLLFRVKKKAKEMYQLMADRGVVTRYRGSETHCSECIRVTIGTKEENDAFLKELVTAWNDLSKE